MGLTRSQKAAALLVAMGPDVAALVMRHLTDAEVEQVAFEVATLGRVTAEEVGDILGEFHAEVVGRAHLVSGGEARAREILRRLRGADGDEIVDRLLASVAAEPFHFLRVHEAGEVAQALRDEHPQTVALILAHLPAKFAAQVLSHLDPGAQGEVARRVATLERTSPDVVARVETALQQRFGDVQRPSGGDRGGVKELAALLNSSDRATERAILGELEATDPSLAEQVRALMFVFEDITTLDDRSVQEILRQVDLKRLALALKGVPPEVVATVERNLSERARQTLLEEIDLLGPVRIREVEEAQTEIVARIRHLDDQGVIVINGDGEFVA